MNQILTEEIKAQWKPVLEVEGLPKIDNKYKNFVTTVLLENERKYLAETGNVAPVNTTGVTAGGLQGGNIATYDPVLISMVRRSTPNMLAFDIAGVQPMTQPTGLIFAMRTRYDTTNNGATAGDEAFFDEAMPGFSQGSGGTSIDSSGFTLAEINGMTQQDGSTAIADTAFGGTAVNVASGDNLYTTAQMESLGDTVNWNKMAFTIDKVAVVAGGRGLRADYTVELAQDLRAIHGLDAEAELASILSTEIQMEQNREIIRRVNYAAKYGVGGTATTANVDLSTATGALGNAGRWFVERFKALLMQIEFEANKVAKATRRGKANFIITSSNIASAMSMAGILDHAPAMSTSMQVDDTGNLFAGVLNGQYKVYIDPYANIDYVTIGYRGANAYDAGIYYCPYVPLEMYRAIGQDTFQPRIGFKTRYGIVANPFATGKMNTHAAHRPSAEGLTAASNVYFRKFAVANLMG